MLSLVENPKDVHSWYIQPTPSEYAWDCVIVASGCVLETGALDPYIEWLWERGLKTRVVNVRDLRLGGNAYNLQARIREWWEYQGTSFVQLVGIADTINPDQTTDEIPIEVLQPIREKWEDGPWRYDYSSYSDILYSSVTCDWNHDDLYPGGILYECWDENLADPDSCSNTPSLWVKGPDYNNVDFWPEVFVGRVALTHCDKAAEQISNWVEKVINYEQSPGNADGLTYLKATLQNRTDGLPSYYFAYVVPYLPSWIHLDWDINQWAWDVISEMNGRSWGWWDVYSHGWYQLFGTSNEEPASGQRVVYSCPFTREQGFYLSPDLGHLTNTNRYFISYTISCLNAFPNYGQRGPEDANISEGFTVFFPERGAVPCLSNTYYGVAPQNPEQHQRFYKWLGSSARRARPFLGPSEAFSKQKGVNPQDEYDRLRSYVAYIHTLFGSPLTPVWTKDNPSTLTADHPSSWTDGIGAPFRVKVMDGNQPVKNAMVTLLLYDNSTVSYPTEANVDVYARAMTGPNGVATFRIAPTISGVMMVTATKQDYLPYLGTCRVSVGKAKKDKSQELLPEKLEITAPTVTSGSFIVNLGIPPENEGQVSVDLYDATGRLILKLYEGYLEAGYHDFNLNTRISSGVYFLRLETGIKDITKKVVIK